MGVEILDHGTRVLTAPGATFGTDALLLGRFALPRRGERALDMCEQAGGPDEIAMCVLQDRSPSCGVGRIYDGTFSGTLTPGNGVFVDLLLRHGYRVIPASEFDPSILQQ